MVNTTTFANIPIFKIEDRIPRSRQGISAFENDSTEIFTAVEQPAEFPGGMSAFAKYLQRNLTVKLSTLNFVGKIYLQFIVNTDGSISELKMLKSISDTINEKSIRLITDMPNWKPAYQSEKAVRSRLTIPITFEMFEEEQSNVQNRLAFLYTLDGKEISRSIFEKLAPNQIEQIEILEEKQAVMKYGERGKNGVIVITSKKK
ncbi:MULTISPECIES: energy transducer TonB [unclassified Arcicella]|uniref:energy transducer TonB n=1 Tax=unclassified Arcicella TaxID=2644986 RepID=UPI00285E7644|nr:MULTISPECIES: energy transducer TonB [unclassified Arcicella]MDR6560833.1 hypothetical protein [Arcicella sp. BE51]MDR6810717.1 hypothetical protein [Arcicella sp. BE140]MDR6822067.1 hypothetical protein [Arcicella sp. BE139]